MTTNLKEGERLDDLGRKGYQIIQNPKSFCFGIDAVLLTGFARIKDGAKGKHIIRRQDAMMRHC